jgi:hypothetical protein
LNTRAPDGDILVFKRSIEYASALTATFSYSSNQLNTRMPDVGATKNGGSLTRAAVADG